MQLLLYRTEMAGKEPIPLDQTVDLEEMKKKSFVEKHPPLSDEEVDKRKREIKEAEEKLSKDVITVENNLMAFLEKAHPIVVDGQPVAWVKDVPWFKILEMIPDEALEEAGGKKTATGPDDVISVIKQIKSGTQTDVIFKMMGELITIPKKEWTWWKTYATATFIRAFNDHLEKRVNEIASDVNFF